MALQLKQYFPTFDLSQKQTNNIIFITFWSQFSTYSINTIFILFLTRPLIMHGLGYDQTKAYAFMGITGAMGYLMPIVGGYMADNVIGIRRSILIGSILVALSYLLVMLSGYTLGALGDTLFIASYALLPATNSLLMGTTSGLISHIYAKDAIKAKSAMTYYYLSINLGALLAVIIAPGLLDSRYGPLSVFAITFVGKSIAALNFVKRYTIYDSAIWGKDKEPFTKKNTTQLVGYLTFIYLMTLYAYFHVYIASFLISIGSFLGILGFLISTIRLTGNTRVKQMIALFLILEAVVFFIIYNQMSTTLILFAQSNSDLNFLGFTISSAQYQMLNPLLILMIGTQLPRFYKRFPGFTIPLQFAAGTVLSGIALLIMVLAAEQAQGGVVNGNYIAITYVFITLAELLVSAIGLSMIGLYCNEKTLALAMGVWYLASSMSNAISGRLAAWVSIPETMHSAVERLPYYENYYLIMGLTALALGLIMYILAYFLHKIMRHYQIEVV
ncbi:MAG: IraAB [Legionella sp.]|nr:IraAB [Legionella sp.]